MHNLYRTHIYISLYVCVFYKDCACIKTPPPTQILTTGERIVMRARESFMHEGFRHKTIRAKINR